MIKVENPTSLNVFKDSLIIYFVLYNQHEGMRPMSNADYFFGENQKSGEMQ